MASDSDPTPSPVFQPPSVSEWWQNPHTVQAVRDYAHMAGLLHLSSTSTGTGEGDKYLTGVPVTLQPSKFPQEFFELVWSIQPDLNDLMDAISRDHKFLTEALQSVIKVDEFTHRLFELHVESQAAKQQHQPGIVFSINRSDYLLEEDADTVALGIKQVELNTIAVAFTGLTQGNIQDLHQYVHNRYVNEDRTLNLPEPTSVYEGLAAACRLYGKPDACVLLVLNKGETNIYDQRALEFELWKRHKVKVIRRTFEDLGTDAHLGQEQELFVSDIEVAVVYYRTGYSPENYASDKDWSTRFLLERSRAISCPTAAFQLVGTKKVQQALAAPGMLERFLKDPEKIQRIRSTFTGLYPLDMGNAGDQAIKTALERPNDFILKPQREGGGNNYYGDALTKVLDQVKSSKEREGYILMERIHSPALKGLIFNTTGPSKIESHPLICELGIYGVYLRQGGDVLMNVSSGCLARSKKESQDEGGVTHGAGVLDFIDLVPSRDYLKLLHEH